jgi:hypothetical protein
MLLSTFNAVVSCRPLALMFVKAKHNAFKAVISCRPLALMFVKAGYLSTTLMSTFMLENCYRLLVNVRSNPEWGILRIIVPKVHSFTLLYYVVVGFSPAELIAEERGEGYSVQAGFLSGRLVRGGPVDLDLTFGTAGKVFPSTPHICYDLCTSFSVGASDITSSAQIRPVHAIPLSQITLTYRLDGVSQEFNETFSMEFNFTPDNRHFFHDSSNVTIGRFHGEITDQDSESRDKFLSVIATYRLIL